MEALAISLLIPLIKKLIDFIRYARAWGSAPAPGYANSRVDGKNGVITQLIVWAAAVVVVLIAAHVDFSQLFSIDSFDLSSLNLWSQVFVGLLLGSSASLVQDAFKSIGAIGSSNTATIPTLLAAPDPVSVVSDPTVDPQESRVQ